jgi:hypothetical protein
MQALARIQAGLSHDLFLDHASQDRYTIFSPIYAFFIRHFGLRAAAISLLVFCKTCFYGAAWALSRKLFDVRSALLSCVLLIVLPLEYGAYHVFHIAEDMLTARSMAESLAMAGLCLHLYGLRAEGLALAAAALSIHALMALPLVLLLLSLRFGIRASLLCAAAAVAAVLCMASAAALAPQWTPGFLRVLDPSWLDIVRERSQFVFLQLWGLDDWESTARPFVSLTLTMLVINDERIRTLCASVMIVGACGLAISMVAGLIGPAAMLLQGQAWRWVWVTELVSVLMLAPTVLRAARCPRCGTLCALLLLAGWLVSLAHCGYLIAAALCLWYGRRHIPFTAIPYIRGAAAGFAVFVIARITGTGWTALSVPMSAMASDGRPLLLARAILGLDCVPVIFAFLVSYWVMRSRSIALAGTIALAFAAVTAVAGPAAIVDRRAEGSAAQLEEFSDWRDAIPPGDNVLVVPRFYTAGFAWFTLQRPSYLTVDQSSGVIFSRATAIEVRRRSQVLLPIEDPDWRLLSRRATDGGRYNASPRPLTRDRLVRLCADPELKFVVAKEDIGFEPIRHRHPGTWQDYNLYDCTRVNSSRATQ